MASKSYLTYGARAKAHRNPLVKKLFEIAEAKLTNLVLAADVTNTKELLDLADTFVKILTKPTRLGPYIAVLKTHIDIISDFGDSTVQGLKRLSEKHNFLIFEDRKFVDIDSTVKNQHHKGALRISEWAHIVNASVLAGDGTVKTLCESGRQAEEEFSEHRGILLLAQMTSKGSVATGRYTQKSIETARKYAPCVMGFVAKRALIRDTAASRLDSEQEEEDFIVFTTGVNRIDRVDGHGQQYQTPGKAIAGGSDFIIVGRGIHEAANPARTASSYVIEAWAAYLMRISS